VIAAVDARQVRLLTSRSVVDEYRTILLDPKIVGAHRALTSVAVEATIRKLAYFSEQLDPVRAKFEFPRDLKDAKFLALAIAGDASHLITFDLDLLSLPNSHSDAAKRLRQRTPGLKLLSPGGFLNELERIGHR
jgi:putative PIN family toxin of toxin-antitoxin system